MRKLGSRLVHEPLVHFALGALLLFALDAWVGSASDGPSYRIEVGPGQIARLEQAWAAQSGRAPSPIELEALIEDQVREEVFYREAVRRGLDDGDVLVKRRLAQKLSFLIEDLAAVDTPTDAELERFHLRHADRYLEPARLSFRHVFFSRDRRADARGDADAVLDGLRAEGRLDDASIRGSIGDPFMLHSEYAGRSHQEIRELFGIEFADAVFALTGSGWQGPVASSYGEHLVQVIATFPAHAPAFAEVRDAVLRDFEATRREEANETAYRDMRARYEIVVEEPEPDREARSEAGR